MLLEVLSRVHECQGLAVFCLGVQRVRRGGVFKTDTFTGTVFWSLPRLCLAAVRVDVFCLGVQRIRRGGVVKIDTFPGTVFWSLPRFWAATVWVNCQWI